MSVEIAWKQNILVTDSYLLKLLLVVFGFGLQAFVCDFSRQNICSVLYTLKGTSIVRFFKSTQNLGLFSNPADVSIRSAERLYTEKGTSTSICRH